MTAAWFASAAAFAFAMSATPGPNNAMVTASGASWGLRRTIPHIAGITVGFPTMILAVALGAGGILRTYPWLQEGLRWVGGSYMLWLAAKIARADPVLVDRTEVSAAGKPLGFFQAAMFQWVNPKAWIAAVGAVVTYTTGGTALIGEAVALVLIFGLICPPVILGWTLVGVGAARLLRTRRALRRFNYAMAALLVASLIPLLTEN